MKDNPFLLNTLLAGITGLVLLILVLVRAFLPAVVLPGLNLPGMTLLSLAALLTEYYLAPGTRRSYPWIFLFSAATFGLLPWAAGMAAGNSVWKLAAAGGAVFTASTWLFSSMADRLSSGVQMKTAPVFSAFGIYLAVQAFAGILL